MAGQKHAADVTQRLHSARLRRMLLGWLRVKNRRLAALVLSRTKETQWRRMNFLIAFNLWRAEAARRERAQHIIHSLNDLLVQRLLWSHMQQWQAFTANQTLLLRKYLRADQHQRRKQLTTTFRGWTRAVTVWKKGKQLESRRLKRLVGKLLWEWVRCKEAQQLFNAKYQRLQVRRARRALREHLTAWSAFAQHLTLAQAKGRALQQRLQVKAAHKAVALWRVALTRNRGLKQASKGKALDCPTPAVPANSSRGSTFSSIATER